MSLGSPHAAARAAGFALLAAAAGSAAAATIARGDVVVLGVATDNGLAFGTADAFSWATLVDLDAGDALFFTNSSWDIQVPAGFSRAESLIRYVAPAGGVAAGTVFLVDLQDLPADHEYVGSPETGFLDPMQLSTFGDQVAVFTGSAAAPSFVFAVNTDQTQWTGASGASGSSRSELYPGLADGADAVAVGAGPNPGEEFDNAYYTGPTSRTDRASWLTRVADRANWTGEDDGSIVTAGDMTAGLGAGGALPVGCPTPAVSFLSVARVVRFARRANAIGYVDTGLTESNFTSAATVTLGADVISVPAGGFVSSGSGAYAWSNATARVRLRRIRGTSRYRLRVDVKDSGPANGATTVGFANDDVAAESSITLANDRFLRGRGEAGGPPLALDYFRTRLLASGDRHFRFRGRIPYDGSGPGAAPDLFVCAGDFDQQIDAGDVTTTARGFRFFDRDVSRGSATGVLRVQVDTVSGIIVVSGRIPDAGSFAGAATPVELGFCQDGDDHAVEVLARVLDSETLHY